MVDLSEVTKIDSDGIAEMTAFCKTKSSSRPNSHIVTVNFLKPKRENAQAREIFDLSDLNENGVAGDSLEELRFKKLSQFDDKLEDRE